MSEIEKNGVETPEEIKDENVVIEEEPQTEETRELTDEEKHELLIKSLKESRIRFKPIKHVGNITTNQFGSAYKKDRRRKNNQQRKSRRANRK
jgi:hypothetical protein